MRRRCPALNVLRQFGKRPIHSVMTKDSELLYTFVSANADSALCFSNFCHLTTVLLNIVLKHSANAQDGFSFGLNSCFLIIQLYCIYKYGPFCYLF